MEIALAILFVDVCDSTRLYEAVGNRRAVEIIQGVLRRLEAVIAGRGGRVVKNLGDGLLCAFPTVDQAAGAAEDMMATTGRAARGEAGVRLRAGIHYGGAIDSDGDVFGDAVNVAARVESLASPHEILLTEEAARRLSSRVGARAHLVDRTTVKGKSAPIGLYKLREETAADDTADRTLVGGDLIEKVRTATQVLRLVYLGEELDVHHDRPKVMIGRNETCDIVIRSRQASREHGSIEFVRESFALTDHSSNGTFVLAGDAMPVPVRRDVVRLAGRGLLGFGAVPERDGEEHVVRFQCDVEV